jgi:hypothetical protein
MSQKWTSQIPWSVDSNYVLRCIEAAFGPSSAGNPMITFKYEVVSPEEVDIGGTMVNIAGTSIKTWQVCQTLEDGVVNTEKSEKNLESLKKLYAAYGLPVDNINPENPDTSGFVGKCVFAYLYNDTQDKRKSPTAAQLAAGQKQGDVLINPVTKQPMKNNYPKVGEIFGLAN